MADGVTAIRELLLADATVAGLVGDRVRVGVADQNFAEPYIVAVLDGDEDDPRNDDLTRFDIDLTIAGATYESVSDVALACKRALKNYIGISPDGVDVRHCGYAGQRSRHERVKGRESGRHVIEQDWEIHFRESDNPRHQTGS